VSENFLNEKEQDHKDLLLDKLENAKEKLWTNLENANEIFFSLNQATMDLNNVIQEINDWVKKIYKQKTEEINALPVSNLTHTMMTELHCYNQKFKKLKVRIPSDFDFSEIDKVNEVLVQFDEMP
jgi:ribosomal protein L23